MGFDAGSFPRFPRKRHSFPGGPLVQTNDRRINMHLPGAHVNPNAAIDDFLGRFGCSRMKRE
jgi:hypothetical protein